VRAYGIGYVVDVNRQRLAAHQRRNCGPDLGGDLGDARTEDADDVNFDAVRPGSDTAHPPAGQVGGDLAEHAPAHGGDVRAGQGGRDQDV